MKSSIRKGFVPKISYHIITWLIVAVALIFKQGSFGKDPYGICSMKVGKPHPRSVIGRIYGVFDFTFRESDKSIKLILMENLFTFNNDSMLRKYDLKGSKHSRRVFKSSKESSKVGKDSKIDKVLKDIDFIDIEKELGILPDEKIQLLRSIEEDV